MSEITVATAEQSEGISQVNQAIVQVDGVTQQNAALVEEAAAAAPATAPKRAAIAKPKASPKADSEWEEF